MLSLRRGVAGRPGVTAEGLRGWQMGTGKRPLHLVAWRALVALTEGSRGVRDEWRQRAGCRTPHRGSGGP